MSAPVDVLAVMDTVESGIRSMGVVHDFPLPSEAVREARAAVAELIEAARFAQETLAKIHGTDATHAARMLAAALEAIA